MANIRSVLRDWAWAVCMSLMIWHGSVMVSGSDNPFVVIMSGSMEPAMYRGDMAIIYNSPAPIVENEVIVFRIKDRSIPIIHRVIAKHANGSMLTKGDSNPVDDREGRIYSKGQDWVGVHDVVGRVWIRLPVIGYISLLLKENLWILYSTLVFLTSLSLVSWSGTTRSSF